MNRITSLSRRCEEKDLATFHDLGRGGLPAMEIAPWGYQHDLIDRKAIVKLITESGIKINSYHLRYDSHKYCNVSVLDEQLRKETVEAHAEHIRILSDLGVPIFVLHPSQEPIGEDREKFKEQTKKSFYSLAQVAKECGVRIAVENLCRTCLGNTIEELDELISVDPSLCVCFDVNHLVTAPHEDFIHHFGKRIITTHISDFDYIDELHRIPGEGYIKWPSLMDAFDDVGYDGAMNYESHFGPIMEKYDRCGYMLAKIIVRNHELLEARKIPKYEDYADLGLTVNMENVASMKRFDQMRLIRYFTGLEDED